MFQNMNKKLFRGLSLAVVLALLIVPLALADDVIADGDIVAAGDQSSVNLGTVSPGATLNPQVSFTLVCSSKNHIDQGQTLTLAFSSSQSTVPTGGNLNATDASIGAIPASWPDDVTGGQGSTNCPSTPPTLGDNGNSLVTITAPTTPGNYTFVVRYTFGSGSLSPAGNNDNSAVQSNHVDIQYTFTVSSLDSTPPVITPIVSGTLGNNGWYVGDVTVSWTVTDPESAISSSTGCDPTTINSDTVGTLLTCSATSAGGTNSQSVTIKRDATAPTISGSASPAANGADWNNTDVTVSFSCADGLSGIASCGPDQTLSGEGAGQSATGTAVDNAGNSASTTVSGINIDKTAPTASASASPTANVNGWNNANVTVSFNGDDGTGSGIDFCSAPVTLSSEGAGQSASGTCTDKAGNVSTSATASGINIDKTEPTASASASPAPNSNGWNNTNVTVSFDGSDGLSGIESCSPDVVLSSEGAGQSASGTCTDMAGNVSAPAEASGINIDKTAPTVVVTGVSNGATYTLGSVPAAGCSTTDALSGVATYASLSLSGGPVVGSITAYCSGAADNAGNAGAASATYTVIYNWTGFFRPVDNTPVSNVAKAGSAIPVKFSLSGNQGLTIFALYNTGYYPISSKINCDSSALEDSVEESVTAGNSSLSYDALADQYIYVWKTDKAWAGTCRQLTVKLVDGTEHLANFRFNK